MIAVVHRNAPDVPGGGQVFYLHYLMRPSPELCEVSAKDLTFDFHLINLEGTGIH